MTSIIVENNGGVRRIWLNRGDAANAQTKQMLVELDAAISQANEDESVRVIVLAGKGKHFSAGHDLKEAQAKRSGFSPEERTDYEAKYYLQYCMNIWESPKPTIAQVQGACVAGGFMLASMADLVVVSEDAWFWDSVLYSMGLAGTEVLFQPWVMGLRHAKEFLFLGERISAAEAYRIGMVNRVVPRDELDTYVMDMATRISSAPPFGMRALKKSLNRTYDIKGFKTAIQAHFDTHQLTHTTAEFAAIRDQGLSTIIGNNKKELGLRSE